MKKLNEFRESHPKVVKAAKTAAIFAAGAAVGVAGCIAYDHFFGQAEAPEPTNAPTEHLQQTSYGATICW